MSMIARIVHLKEKIVEFYTKHADWLDPVLKGSFSFVALMIFRLLFPFGSSVADPKAFLLVSVIQAFMPTIVMFFSVFILILSAVWNISMDIFCLFLILMLIYLLAFAKTDKKYVYIMLLTPIMFYYHLEYFLPVVLGLLIGYGAILPCVGGILLYFTSQYTAEAATLLNATENPEVGMGIQRIFEMMSMDRYMQVVVVTFAFIILLTCFLEQLLYEKTWLLALIGGNIALAICMLVGKLFFEYDLSTVELFVEAVACIGIGHILMLFRGMGDVSRIERVSFEDDEYIYYVKAVPKMKITQEESYEKIIKSEKEV